MNVFEKYLVPKNIVILGIINGVLGTVLYLLCANGGTEAFLKSGAIITILYYVLCVVGALLCAGSIFRFVKHSEDKTALINAIAGGLTVVLLLMGYEIISIIHNYSSGNWLTLASYAYRGVDSIKSAGRLLTFGCFASIVGMVLDILALLTINGKAHIDFLNPYGTPINNNYYNPNANNPNLAYNNYQMPNNYNASNMNNTVRTMNGENNSMDHQNNESSGEYKAPVGGTYESGDNTQETSGEYVAPQVSNETSGEYHETQTSGSYNADAYQSETFSQETSGEYHAPVNEPQMQDTANTNQYNYQQPNMNGGYNPNMNNNYQQPQSKPLNKKIIIGIVALALIIGGGFFGWKHFFGGTRIDLAKNIEVSFYGESGSAYVQRVTNNVDYDKSNQELALFVRTLTYDYDTSRTLKNGDKIKVTAVYNKERAEALNLKITNVEKEVEVKGLTYRFSKASDIPSDFITLAKSEADAKVKERYASSSYFTYTPTYDSVWFQKSNSTSSYYGDRIIVVYKMDMEYKATGTKSTYYIGAQFTGLNSEFKTKNRYWSAGNLYDSSYSRVESADKIQTALTNATYTAEKVE